MSKFACAVACLLLTTAALAGEPADCPMWPKAHPNMQRLRALMCGSDIAAIEKYFDQRHRDYETGSIDGGQLLWSYAALNQPFPYERLTDWLKQYPASYAAHIAIADELIDRALQVRGSELAKDTPAEKFAAMSSLLQRADSYLTRSLSLNKKPYLTYYHLIRVGQHTRSAGRRNAAIPSPVLRGYLDKAIHLDGPAFIARASYMISLQTRWGGNLEAMRRHYEDSTKAGLNQGQLDRLRSMVLFEESWLMDVEKHAEARLKLAVQANALYEDTQYLSDIIWLKVRVNRWADAFPELDRAIQLNPHDEWVRCRRAKALFVMERHAEAYKDFRICAETGDASAQNKVGWYLMMGVGVPQNKREGAQWFAKAAAGGDKDGINNLKQAKAEGSI